MHEKMLVTIVFVTGVRVFKFTQNVVQGSYSFTRVTHPGSGSIS